MLTIYGAPFSVHTRKVVFAALYKALPFEVVPVVPVIPGNLPANWHELSPSGRIPALTDGSYTVSDSGAICVYLDRMHPSLPLYPNDAKLYARVHQLEAYATEVLFHDVVRTLFHEVIVHPKIQGIPTNRKIIEETLTTKLPGVFSYLNAAIEGGHLVGDQLSIADISVVSNLVTYQYIGFDLYRDKFPHLAALFDRIIRQPAMREALRREQVSVRSMGLNAGFLSAVLS